jgi:hypothetical protein
MRRSRSAEAAQELKALFNRAATYYQRERADAGITGEHRIDCIVGDVDNSVNPSAVKQQGEYLKPEWVSLGFDTFYGYFRYEVHGAGGPRCGIPANSAEVYTLRALGDLDDDDTNSTFDLAVGSNDDNELYHARGFNITNDYE